MQHLEVTRNHAERIEQTFELLGVAAKAKTCDGMKGIIAEGEKTLGEVECPLRDVAITSAARRVEHYEMAAYAADPWAPLFASLKPRYDGQARLL
jgi:ferritin-like metal-binding protein YciE